jgi:hypothetical protein
MYITQTAAAPSRYHGTLIIIHEVCNQLVCLSITDNCATWDPQDKVFTPGSVFFLARSSTTRKGLEMLVIAKINQCIQFSVCFHIDAAPSTTIPTIGASIRYELFTPEVNGAIPTIASLNVYFCMIVKHNISLKMYTGEFSVSLQ